MVARTPVQSRWWRFFALACVAIAAPTLLKAHSGTEWLRSVMTAIALFGLVGYAFGFRVGPRMLWAAFAAVFCTAATVKFGRVVASGTHPPAAIALGVTIFALLSLALFRHAELVSGGRNALASGPAEPLFPSRAEQWRIVQQRMAEARSAMAQPMSAAMRQEAMSFGQSRQLGQEQHQRAITILFVGTILLQVGLTFFLGRNEAIVIPATALGIGCATTTYLSAEVILKAQAQLAKTWKAGLLLLALTIGLFVVRDQTAIRLWLVQAILLDTTAMVVGNLLVSSTYALARRS